MTRTSVNFTEREDSIIEDLTGENGPYDSRSEAVRECVQSYVQLHNEIEELHNKIDRLEREKRMILEQREENTELIEYVDDEKRFRRANILTRAKWWLRGMPN